MESSLNYFAACTAKLFSNIGNMRVNRAFIEESRGNCFWLRIQFYILTNTMHSRYNGLQGTGEIVCSIEAFNRKPVRHK